jgi:hypothetical protein
MVGDCEGFALLVALFCGLRCVWFVVVVVVLVVKTSQDKTGWEL